MRSDVQAASVMAGVASVHIRRRVDRHLQRTHGRLHCLLESAAPSGGDGQSECKSSAGLLASHFPEDR